MLPFVYKGNFSWAWWPPRIEDYISHPPLQLGVAKETSASQWDVSTRILYYLWLIPLKGGVVLSLAGFTLPISCVEGTNKIPVWHSNKLGSRWVPNPAVQGIGP